MTNPTTETHASSLSLASRLQAIIVASWMTQATYVAVQLRLPDLLAEGPKTSAELAALSGSHAPSLLRLLRALTTLEICQERADGAFALTPLGALLRTDTPNSLRSLAIFVGGPQWPLWGNLLHSVRTGETARKLLSGTEDFQHLARDPELAALFNQTMVQLTRLVAHDVAQVYPFAGMARLLDVGGGSGELLAAILQAHTAARGVLFDMDHARAAGQRHLEALGLAERCEVVTGDFFEAVPGPAEAILLKSILHDWDDDQSRAILENCRLALAEGGKLLIIERLMPEQLEPSPTHQLIARSDLMMLVGPGGRERTRAEFQALLASADLSLSRVIPTASGFAIIEAVAA